MIPAAHAALNAEKSGHYRRRKKLTELCLELHECIRDAVLGEVLCHLHPVVGSP